MITAKEVMQAAAMMITRMMNQVSQAAKVLAVFILYFLQLFFLEDAFDANVPVGINSGHKDATLIIVLPTQTPLLGTDKRVTSEIGSDLSSGAAESAALAFLVNKADDSSRDEISIVVAAFFPIVIMEVANPIDELSIVNHGSHSSFLSAGYAQP